MRNYSGFYQGHSGYYMVFMNYIAALTLARKNYFASTLSDCHENEVFQDQSSSIKVFSPSPTLSYTITKKPGNFLRCKSYWGSWNSWESLAISSAKVFLLKTDLLFFYLHYIFWKTFTLKVAVTDMKYFATSKFSRSLVHKKNFSLIWQVVFKLGYVFCQER